MRGWSNNRSLNRLLYMLCGMLLQVGNAGLSATESRAHFSLWCALCAPLLIGTDLLRASADTLAILGNADLIALNQDPLGFQGSFVMTCCLILRIFGLGSPRE